MYNPDSACVNLRSTGFIDLKKQNSEIRFSYQQSQGNTLMRKELIPESSYDILNAAK
jgi:hypothetical protein